MGNSSSKSSSAPALTTPTRVRTSVRPSTAPAALQRVPRLASTSSSKATSRPKSIWTKGINLLSPGGDRMNETTGGGIKNGFQSKSKKKGKKDLELISAPSPFLSSFPSSPNLSELTYDDEFEESDWLREGSGRGRKVKSAKRLPKSSHHGGRRGSSLDRGMRHLEMEMKANGERGETEEWHYQQRSTPLFVPTTSTSARPRIITRKPVPSFYALAIPSERRMDGGDKIELTLSTSFGTISPLSTSPPVGLAMEGVFIGEKLAGDGRVDEENRYESPDSTSLKVRLDCHRSLSGSIVDVEQDERDDDESGRSFPRSVSISSRGSHLNTRTLPPSADLYHSSLLPSSPTLSIPLQHQLTSSLFTALFNNRDLITRSQHDGSVAGSDETAEEDRGYKRSCAKPTEESMGWATYKVVSPPKSNARLTRRQKRGSLISPSSVSGASSSISSSKNLQSSLVLQPSSVIDSRPLITTKPTSRSSPPNPLDLSTLPAPSLLPPPVSTPTSSKAIEPLSPASTLDSLTSSLLSSSSLSSAATSLSPFPSVPRLQHLHSSVLQFTVAPHIPTSSHPRKPRTSFPFPASPPLPSRAELVDSQHSPSGTRQGSFACPVTPSPDEGRDRRKFSGVGMMTNAMHWGLEEIHHGHSVTASRMDASEAEEEEEENNEEEEEEQEGRLGSPSKRGFSKGEIRKWIAVHQFNSDVMLE